MSEQSQSFEYERISRPGHGEPCDLYENDDYVTDLESWTVDQVEIIEAKLKVSRQKQDMGNSQKSSSD